MTDNPQRSCESNEEIAKSLLMFPCHTDIVRYLDSKDQEILRLKGEVERLKAPVSICSKHQDYNKDCELCQKKYQIISHEELTSLRVKLEELKMENQRLLKCGYTPSKGYTREDGINIPEGWHEMGS